MALKKTTIASGHLEVAFQHVKGAYKKCGEELLTIA